MGITFRLLGQRKQEDKLAKFFVVFCYAGFDLLDLANEGTPSESWLAYSFSAVCLCAAKTSQNSALFPQTVPDWVSVVFTCSTHKKIPVWDIFSKQILKRP
jgi:hypothetical protein